MGYMDMGAVCVVGGGERDRMRIEAGKDLKGHAPDLGVLLCRVAWEAAGEGTSLLRAFMWSELLSVDTNSFCN